MAKSRSDFKLSVSINEAMEFTNWSTPKKEREIPENNIELSTMKKGYREMGPINLALSNLYFQVESEAQSYYDRIPESE